MDGGMRLLFKGPSMIELRKMAKAWGNVRLVEVGDPGPDPEEMVRVEILEKSSPGPGSSDIWGDRITRVIWPQWGLLGESHWAFGGWKR